MNKSLVETTENSKGRILLAEDDDDLRELIYQRLESDGYEVLEASSGVELLDLLTAEHRFDLVISDVRMPWVSGLSVAQAIRRIGNPVPFLIMSAFGDEVLRKSVSEIGAANFIEKPFALSLLLAKVSELRRVPSV